MDFSILTRRLQIVREFWHFGDLVLPVAVPVIPAGTALAILFTEFKVGGFLHISVAGLPFPLPLLLPFLLPAVGWWFAAKPAIEELPIQHWLVGQFRYVFEPKTIVHFERAWEPSRPRLREVVFQEFALEAAA